MVDVMVLFGSGGHSTEMLLLTKSANLTENAKVKKLIYVISEDDNLICRKIDQEMHNYKGMQRKLETVTLRRARRVGQSYLTAIWTTIIGIIHSIYLIHTHKPKLCLTNGPAISVVVSLSIRFLQVITFGRYYKCDIIYIESFCRTRTLSLSGKIIYHSRLANEFYVQWPALRVLYPRAKYKGVLV